MAHLRQIPSGKWQAAVRLPGGRRVTRTDVLKRVVAEWARGEEVRIARGEWRDARMQRVSYDDWRDRWLAARVVEPHTLQGDRSTLKNHLDPHWSGWRLPAMTRIEVQSWVRKMQQAGVGPHAIRRAYNLLASIMGAAVDEGLITESPCRRIARPATPVQQPRWFTPAEVAAIREHLPWRHSVAVELMVWTGIRWGEMAGLRVQDVDWLRRRIKIVGAATQDGHRKDYPKSAKSRREVPVPPHVIDLLSPLVKGRKPADRLFCSTRKGNPPWSGANWRGVWADAVKAAGAPPHSPHALRHTAASWLVQAGVELYDVQALLGHENYATTAKYSHLKPGEHGAVEGAWERLAAQQRQIANEGSS